MLNYSNKQFPILSKEEWAIFYEREEKIWSRFKYRIPIYIRIYSALNGLAISYYLKKDYSKALSIHKKSHLFRKNSRMQRLSKICFDRGIGTCLDCYRPE